MGCSCAHAVLPGPRHHREEARHSRSAPGHPPVQWKVSRRRLQGLEGIIKRGATYDSARRRGGHAEAERGVDETLQQECLRRKQGNEFAIVLERQARYAVGDQIGVEITEAPQPLVRASIAALYEAL